LIEVNEEIANVYRLFVKVIGVEIYPAESTITVETKILLVFTIWVINSVVVLPG